MKKLLTPDPSRIGRPEGAAPQPDAVPADRANGAPAPLLKALRTLLGAENVSGRVSDLIRYASDASPYRTVPQIVVRPRNAHDLSRLMRFAARNDRKLTFRAAGTSLNGQAMSDDILVDVKTHFTGMEVRDGGQRIWSRPGVVLGDAQAVLARHGHMIGPDPGSTPVCTIGGVLADNAGGMRCSLERDSYHTLEEATFVLPSGTIVDTMAPDAEAKLEEAEPELVAGLLALRDEIRGDTELVDFLRRKFSIRNTNGLRLDAFLDEDTPVRILMRLMVGSEGIFGAITESVIRTIKLPRHKAVAWVMLPDLRQAASYVAPLMETGALACELLVAPVLKRSVDNFREAPADWADIDDNTAALLLEVGGTSEEELERAIAAAQDVLADAELLSPLAFDRSPEGQRGAWKIRNGLFGLIGSDRPQGTALITEDVCFPPAQVGRGAADLLDLLSSYGYPEMVMGHAAFGNLHFFLLPRLDDDGERARYAAFLDDLARLVIDDYQGSLKAEHGTGVNMAPFLLREWGDRAWELMWRVKELIDPRGILAPNVKLTRSQDIHLQRFKSFPKVEDEINACVECGFCEPVCPSRHVTVTPRQRIVLRREMARQPEGSEVLARLQEEYGYDAIEMCAADGTCAVACPISIDTGKVMKMFRAAEHDGTAEHIALGTARNFRHFERAARGGVKAAELLDGVAGTGALRGVATAGRAVISSDILPTIPGKLPHAAPRTMPATQREGASAVYFPACINRIFGRPHGAPADQLELPRAIVELGRRSGRPVWIPGDVEGNCCGTPWSSKGYTRGFEDRARAIAADLWRWTDGGALPVVVDAASCTHGLLEQVPGALDGDLAENFSRIRILDVVDWLRDEVVDGLTFTDSAGRVAVHPTCSTTHMGINDDLVALVRRVADEVVVPDKATCCGTAGDRGLLHPELVESATREERAGLTGHFDAFVSDNRTCEMGLEMIAGKPYQSVASLLEKASRPVVTP
ncbi:FAD-binding oxidoreductase [Corynebacterium sp. CCM 8835]|uniref:D-lactate dehydrogenase (cytochrome) n=1 Tax=Corynebacterium antarcticum TaxID=2800405 RepID=A0ABS1FKK3_9CORY|nr:FAD-binding and (Fe-S)-binding domain-containing protein [Corynebacterium antarcticum]MCK7641358.1 FAD-binding oxidoreductase [Corynebacterium antarcticum]MCL0244589.1 FAD-binding oxidoreductase [Corynebacterium antarcticum]MCX7490959.1 FAD-binding and (Fe-S)-binding domain-containing protein [Corynebacterium antarcticum]